MSKGVLNTSVSHNGGSVDKETLLTPIQSTRQTPRQGSLSTMEKRVERNLWRPDEVLCMLFAMQNIKALDQLNNKNVKSEKVFKDVEEIMFSNGFRKKTHGQIWTKWKFLKSTYNTSQRNGIMPRIVSPEIYAELHKMLRHKSGGRGRGNNGPGSGASDMGSEDGDNSNMETTEILISDVAGGLNSSLPNGEDLLDDRTDSERVNGQEDKVLDMAHPIFGFRLGLVKPEPTDTCYDSVERIESERDTFLNDMEDGNIYNVLTANEPLTQIKQEIEEGEEQFHQIIPLKILSHYDLNTNNNINEYLLHTQPGISTPDAKQNEHVINLPENKLPPLRVAPFAHTVKLGVKKFPSRPPPSLTMPIHVTNLHSDVDSTIKNGTTTTLTKANVKDTKSNQNPRISMESKISPIKLSREITIQQTKNFNSQNLPKLKQVPMRKTPYSLRPDRLIPDLDSSVSPPASETSSGHHMEELTFTNPLVLQAQHSTENVSSSSSTKIYLKRKRRLDWQGTHTTAADSSKYNLTSTSLNHDMANETKVNDITEHQHKSLESGNYEKVIGHIIKEVTSSLREIQHEMMLGFLKTQKDLIRQEHIFQMQQDDMLMKTFQEQTCNIVRTITELMVDKKHYATRPRGRPRKYHTSPKQVCTKRNVKDDSNGKTQLSATEMYSDYDDEEDLRGYKEAEEFNSDEQPEEEKVTSKLLLTDVKNGRGIQLKRQNSTDVNAEGKRQSTESA